MPRDYQLTDTQGILDLAQMIKAQKMERRTERQMRSLLDAIARGASAEEIVSSVGQAVGSGPTGLGGILDALNPLAPSRRGVTPIEELIAGRGLQRAFSSTARPTWSPKQKKLVDLTRIFPAGTPAGTDYRRKLESTLEQKAPGRKWGGIKDPSKFSEQEIRAMPSKTLKAAARFHNLHPKGAVRSHQQRKGKLIQQEQTRHIPGSIKLEDLPDALVKGPLQAGGLPGLIKPTKFTEQEIDAMPAKEMRQVARAHNRAVWFGAKPGTEDYEWWAKKEPEYQREGEKWASKVMPQLRGMAQKELADMKSRYEKTLPTHAQTPAEKSWDRDARILSSKTATKRSKQLARKRMMRNPNLERDPSQVERWGDYSKLLTDKMEKKRHKLDKVYAYEKVLPTVRDDALLGGLHPDLAEEDFNRWWDEQYEKEKGQPFQKYGKRPGYGTTKTERVPVDLPFETTTQAQSEAPDMRLDSVWMQLPIEQRKVIWENEDKVKAALDNGYSIEEVLGALEAE